MALYSYAFDTIDLALKSQVDYVDVRLENTFENFLGIKNDKTSNINTKLQEKMGVRILFNGCWGFAAISSLDNTSIKKTVQTAIRSAKKAINNSANKKKILATITSQKTRVIDECKKIPQFVETSERYELLKNIKSQIISCPIHIPLINLKLIENQTQKILVNSDGSDIEQTLIRTNFYVGSTFTGINSIPKIRTSNFGGVGGIELFDGIDFESFIHDYIESLPRIIQAKQIKPQKLPVVLNEEMSWNLCHEFSHAVEADLVLEGRSPLRERLGNKIGSEKVTIIDDASFNGFGQYFFDDEGVKASGTLIVENGLLLDLLKNRETAEELNEIPTSNSRAESSLYLPQVRQSNIFFESGDSSFDELLEQTNNGIFVCDSLGAISDTLDGNFQINAQYGYKIVKGELTDCFTNFSLVGNLYTILGDVTSLSDNIKSYPAFCEKNGQQVFVGAISPKTSLKKIAIITNIPQPQIKKIDFQYKEGR